MKKSILKFLVALPLCLSFMLVGCGQKLPKQNEVEADQGPASYWDVVTPDTLAAVDFGTLTLVHSGLMDSVFDRYYLFKETDKDVMNNVVETFVIHDAAEGKDVLTLTHKYADGAYGNASYKDDFDNEYKKPSEMTVEIEYTAMGAPYVRVTTLTNTKIADDVLEKEENNDGYVQTVKVDVYGVDGTFIGSENRDISVEDVAASLNATKVVFGRYAAEISNLTGKVLKTWNTAKGHKNSLYDYETKNYGVYLNVPFMMNGAVETYDAEGKLVNRYVYESAYQKNSFMLNNGNVLIQYLDDTQGAQYDVMMGGVRIKVRTLILDTLSGKTTAVESPYYFMSVTTAKDHELHKEAGDFAYNGVQNVASVYTLSKTLDVIYTMEEPVEILMNSALEVSGTLQSSLPEYVLENEAYDIGGGKLVVGLTATHDSRYAVVNKSTMKIERYLPEGVTLISGGYATNEGIYDFEGNLKYTYNLDYYYGPQEFVVEDSFGGVVFLRDALDVESPLYAFGLRSNYDYQTPYYTYIGTFYDTKVYGKGEDFVVLYEEDEYVLYGEDMNRVLATAAPIQVNACGEGAYMVITEIDGKTVCYSLKAIPTSDGGDEQ